MKTFALPSDLAFAQCHLGQAPPLCDPEWGLKSREGMDGWVFFIFLLLLFLLLLFLLLIITVILMIIIIIIKSSRLTTGYDLSAQGNIVTQSTVNTADGKIQIKLQY